MATRRPSRAKAIFAILTLSVALGAVFAAPASAHADRGDRLNMFNPPSTMAARTPFYLSNGYCTDLRAEVWDLLRPSTRVVFKVDGKPLRTHLHLEFDPKGQIDGICIALKHDEVDFRVGLPAGVHTFQACYYWVGVLDTCLEATISFE